VEATERMGVKTIYGESSIEKFAADVKARPRRVYECVQIHCNLKNSDMSENYANRGSHARMGVILKTTAPDARRACTRSLYARFRHSSTPQHTRFSTGQNGASENGSLGESRKRERWL
jgi:hypothetical protein